jgi:hypothetical protein
VSLSNPCDSVVLVRVPSLSVRDVLRNPGAVTEGAYIVGGGGRGGTLSES